MSPWGTADRASIARGSGSLRRALPRLLRSVPEASSTALTLTPDPGFAGSTYVPRLTLCSWAGKRSVYGAIGGQETGGLVRSGVRLRSPRRRRRAPPRPSPRANHRHHAGGPPAGGIRAAPGQPPRSARLGAIAGSSRNDSRGRRRSRGPPGTPPSLHRLRPRCVARPHAKQPVAQYHRGPAILLVVARDPPQLSRIPVSRQLS